MGNTRFWKRENRDAERQIGRQQKTAKSKLPSWASQLTLDWHGSTSSVPHYYYYPLTLVKWTSKPLQTIRRISSAWDGTPAFGRRGHPVTRVKLVMYSPATLILFFSTQVTEMSLALRSVRLFRADAYGCQISGWQILQCAGGACTS